jgi:hypothetical protein
VAQLLRDPASTRAQYQHHSSPSVSCSRNWLTPLEPKKKRFKLVRTVRCRVCSMRPGFQSVGLILISLLYCAIYTTALSSSILHDCATNLQESNQFEPIMGKHPPSASPKCRAATARSISCTPHHSVSLASSHPFFTISQSYNSLITPD